jgi:ketosteroid isomerase-like protein
VQEYMDDHGRVTFRPVNPEFFVTGTSALAWGAYSLTAHPKVGPREALHGRYTFAYTQAAGQWRLAALHLSPLQEY